MLSLKTAIILTTAIIAGGVSACGTPLNDDEMHVLLTEDDIWSSATPGLLGRWPSTKPWDTRAGANFEDFSGRVIKAFKDSECIKHMFLNKANWEHAYPTAREKIIARLYRFKKLDLLKFDSLTDSACKEVINVAGTGYPDESLGDEPGDATQANYQLKASQFINFRAGCWDTKASSIWYWDPATVKNIPPQAFNDFRVRELLPNIVGDPAKEFFAKWNDKQLASYISNPERCAVLSKDVVLSHLHQSIVGKYTAACLNHLTWLKDATSPAEKEAAATWVKRLNSKAFSTVDYSIHKDFVEVITPAQAAEIDSDNQTELRCSNLDNLHELSVTAFAKVDKTCFAGFLAGAAPASVLLDKKIAKAPGNIFSSIPLGDIQSIAKVMTPQNIKSLSTEHLKSLLAVPVACQFIKPPSDNQKLEWPRFPVISAACWAHIPDPTRTLILANESAIKRLDEKILMHAEKGDFSKDALVVFAKKRVVLLKYLGALVPAGHNHPCSEFSLDNYREDKEIRAIVDASNGPCVRSLTGLGALEEETADKEFFRKLPPIIFASMDLSVLREHKHLPKDFWSQMRPLVFEILSTPANCAELDTALLAQINVEALSVLHWDCLAVLKGELTSGQVAKVPKAIFEQVDTTTWPKLNHPESISTDQLASLSTKVSDGKKHAGTLFTETTIGALSAAQVGVLNVGTVNALPDSAWKGFDPERFKALRPEVLVRVTCNKLKQVPEASLYEITAAQARRLGEGINKVEESPRCVFTKEVLKKVKDPEAVKIISGASQLVVSLLLVVASMLLGLWLA